jgi:mannose-6-phosphate isomerase-like protein (cupin superfamily)
MITFKAPSMAIKSVTPEEMQKRVARYKSLRYPADRYPDSQLPGHIRKNFLVVGRGLVVDGGNDPMSAIPIDEGFQMSYVEAPPGNGPILHNHDSNETFVAVRGRWRVIWGRNEEHHVDLDPLDVCSVPPFVPRRFINLEGADGKEGLLLTIQPGNAPNVEFLNPE